MTSSFIYLLLGVSGSITQEYLALLMARVTTPKRAWMIATIFPPWAVLKTLHSIMKKLGVAPSGVDVPAL